MRPYGVRIVESPDVADIKLMGAKSSIGDDEPNELGQYRGICRGAAKARTRRYWKRVARAESKQLVCDID